MKIVDYDGEHYAILVNKRVLRNANFNAGEDVYVVVLENGLLGVIKKSSFKAHLKEAVKHGLQERAKTHTAPSKNELLSSAEESLLNKILSHRFEDRTPSNILNRLTDAEKNVLKSLVNRGVLSVYKKGKYKGRGVYVVSKDIYNLINPFRPKNDDSRISQDASRRSAGKRGEKPEDAVKQLNAKGFILISGDDVAKQVSQMLHDKVKRGDVVGIKGFDSNYYIFTKQYYSKLYNNISNYFENSNRATLSELSSALKIDEHACKGMLAIMLEKGDITERKKNVYELV